MPDKDWDDLVDALHDPRSAGRAVAAAEEIHRSASVKDIPRLRALLQDDSFFVREAAAWPLSDLGVTDALPELLEALCRGYEEGHDNDGLAAALADLAEAKPEESAAILKEVVASGERRLREHAMWLLEFCGDGRDA